MAVRLQRLQDIIDQWQQKTFVNNEVKPKLTHLAKELGEIIENPDDKMEWADALILLLGAAAIQKISIADLYHHAKHKMHINSKRKWAPPDEHGVQRHIE